MTAPEHAVEFDYPLTEAEREALYPVVRKSVGAYMVIERVLRERTARLRDEVIAVIAEHLWDGDENRQPDYDGIAELFDDALANVSTPPASEVRDA